MPRGDLHSPKTVISLKFGGIDVWLEADRKDFSGESIIIGELSSIMTGRPKPGLANWRLRERVGEFGVRFQEFEDALNSLNSLGILNLR